jgi:hypothetical protein
VIASLQDVAIVAPLAFGMGCAVGFIVGARYRITKRNGKEDA